MNEKENINKENEPKEKKKGFVTWWNSLPKVVRITSCSIAGLGVISAIVFPTLTATIWNKNGSRPVKPEPTPVKEYIVTFDTDGGTKVPSQKVKENEMAIEPANPSKQKDLENNYSFIEWQLDETKFSFSTPITHNITLKAKYDDTSSVIWYSDSAYINGLTEEDVTNDIIRGVTVNGKSHNVRLIGIDHDVDENDNKLHTTWEFANIISDANGDSLAYQWNDTNDTSSANYDYTNSTIRYALTGEGGNGGKSGEKANEILVAQKGGKTWSKDENYNNKTIISMLPSSLTSKLKTVKKSVGVYTTGEYTETPYYDKLFMLSTIELGYSSQYDKGFGSTYSYYEKATDTKRIKKQVNNSEVYTSSSQIPSGSGQAYNKGNINNYAGYNYKSDNTGGGIYWLCSPLSIRSNIAWHCRYDGCVANLSGYVYNYAYGVAPAFCL